jgi:hypothetical protein
MGLKFQFFFLNNKEMNKVSSHINILCIFSVTFYGGEKFLHQKAVFFILSITPTVIDKITPNFNPD